MNVSILIVEALVKPLRVLHVQVLHLVKIRAGCPVGDGDALLRASSPAYKVKHAGALVLAVVLRGRVFELLLLAYQHI